MTRYKLDFYEVDNDGNKIGESIGYNIAFPESVLHKCVELSERKEIVRELYRMSMVYVLDYLEKRFKSEKI